MTESYDPERAWYLDFHGNWREYILYYGSSQQEETVTQEDVKNHDHSVKFGVVNPLSMPELSLNTESE